MGQLVLLTRLSTQRPTAIPPQRSVSVFGFSALHGQCGTEMRMNNEKGEEGMDDNSGGKVLLLLPRDKHLSCVWSDSWLDSGCLRRSHAGEGDDVRARYFHSDDI